VKQSIRQIRKTVDHINGVDLTKLDDSTPRRTREAAYCTFEFMHAIGTVPSALNSPVACVGPSVIKGVASRQLLLRLEPIVRVKSMSSTRSTYIS
jgi:hypothetical protein